MALLPRLDFRQTQSLVMTPQLLQAIKLLQLSNLDLAAFVDAELERNPLLDRAEAPDMEPSREAEAVPLADPEAGDWLRPDLDASRSAMEDGLGTEMANVFQDDAVTGLRAAALDGEAAVPAPAGEGLDPYVQSWSSLGSGSRSDGEAPDYEAFVAAEPTLSAHLEAQLALAVPDPARRMIGAVLIDAIDEAGYLGVGIEEVAARLSTPPEEVEAVLAVIHTFEPSGVGARSLRECLALQLRERDRLDPCMERLLDRLDLLAKRDTTALKRQCGVDDEDLTGMIREIRALSPKPGLLFGQATVQPVVPDVLVRAAPDGSWLVELNPDTLPRLLVNQAYHARVSRVARSEAERGFLSEALQTANWLTRSLEQRARTILKVAAEIVRQQDAFFVYGVEYLRPLNLRTVAEAIGMHESTVSRVTANKYLAGSRGVFELKYFFTASIPAATGGEAHSAEAVRHRIRQLVDAEAPDAILSDDAIVQRLREGGVEIARRTVAKYREALRISSSVERRREKAVAL